MTSTNQTITQIIKATNGIQRRTIEDNDLAAILDGLYLIIEISEQIINNNDLTEFYWNEIKSELIAVIYSSISGYSRLGISGLRNIQELLCHAFYYYDHPIELKLSMNEDIRTNRHVTALIKNYLFFTTKYIRTFNPQVDLLEKKTDVISNYLKAEYSSLCDVVHGRHSTLTKQTALKIKYSKKEFKNFETHFLNIASLIANMYILRFNDFSNLEIVRLAKRLKLLRI